MEEIIAFLEKIAEAAHPVGLVLYNPGHAKRKLSPQEWGIVRSRIAALVGCKVAGGDESWYRAMQQHVPGFSVFVPGHTLATGFKMGAQGAYSNVACVHPKIAQQWYDQMKTDLPAALALEKRILLFINEHISPLITEERYAPQACDKLLAAIGGWANIGTRLRWPYRSIPEERVTVLQKKAQQLLPEFFQTTK
jgi:dihydrodipicolinate synthase/N-acetylneuraminate lyase